MTEFHGKKREQEAIICSKSTESQAWWHALGQEKYSDRKHQVLKVMQTRCYTLIGSVNP